MPEITGSRIGHFCWFELATTDRTSAKKFYSELFGWTWNDSPTGPDSFYTTFQRTGRDVGACYTLQPGQQAQGIPPHWMTDRKSTRLNSSHIQKSRMPSSA